MRRRELVGVTALTALVPATPLLAQPARPRPPTREEIRARMQARLERLREFRTRLEALLADLPRLEAARGFRELEYRHASLTGLRAEAKPFGSRLISASAPAKPRFTLMADPAPASTGKPATKSAEIGASTLAISADAVNMIITFEVGSAALYTSRYQAPVWPGGNSGVTIGVGYDLGWNADAAFSAAWAGLLPDNHHAVLVPSCGQKADKAHALANQAEVKALRISWDQASQQFNRTLGLYIGETQHAFDNCDGLSEDSRGALVSLVYNRGGDTSNTPRRAEMYNIAQLMAAKNYAAVPAQIRAMKRLWQDVAGASGLVERRELEAKLFEAGLD